MARPMKPLVRGGGYYPSNRWIPLVYPGGYTTMNSGGEPTPSVVWVTVSGASPLSLVNAAASNIRSLTQTGKCVQNGTPTPDAPVDIVCNNGAIKFGWHDIITTSQLSGYGTYVSPAQAATTRAYRWFKDLPNGTYTFSVDGDYEIIVQWRDPADPADGLVQGYENLTGWITSGEVTLDKTTGGYGIAVKRTVGTSSITPANFDGVLHVAERGLYVVGTPEVLSVTASGAATQTASVPMLLSVGDYKDEAELISGIKTGKIGVKVFDGTETATLQSINSYGIANFYIGISNKVPSVAALLCTHFELQTSSISETRTDGILNGATAVYFRVNSATASTPQELSALFAAQYAAGTPVIVLYPLAEETTEQTTPQPLRTKAGDNTVSVVSEVDPVELSVDYAQPESGGS